MTSAQDSIATLADLRLKVGNRGHFPSCKVWWDKRPDMKTPLGTLRPLFYRPSTRTRNPPEAPVQHNKTGPEFFSFQLFSRTRILAPFEPFLQILLIYKLKLLALTQFCLSVSVLWFLVVPRCCRVHEPAVPAARLSQILLWRLVSSSTRSLHHWKLAFLTGLHYSGETLKIVTKVKAFLEVFQASPPRRRPGARWKWFRRRGSNIR